MTIVAAALLALGAAASCGPYYAGPATFPASLHGHVGEALLVTGSVSSGGSPAPAKIRVLDARCADPAICETFAAERDVAVGGKQAGKTEIVLRFEHPTTHEQGEQHIPVVIGEARKRHVIDLGPPLERPKDQLWVLEGVAGPKGPQAYRCATGAATQVIPQRLDPGDVMRGTPVFYTCSAPVEFPSGASYFGPAPGEEDPARRPSRVLVCLHTQTRGGHTTAMWIYDDPHPAQSEPHLLGKRGEPKDVCAAR